MGKGKNNRYTEEFKQYIRDNSDKTSVQLCKLVQELYPQYIMTPGRIHTLRNRIKSCYTGDYSYRIQKGQVIGANKGGKRKPMSQETREKIGKWWFKKGQKPPHTLPIGSETRNKRDGRIMIKLDNGKWIPKIRHMYELYHNETLTSDDRIVAIDGNQDNFAEDNLMKINKRMVLKLNSNSSMYNLNGDRDYNLCNLNALRLEDRIKEIEKK